MKLYEKISLLRKQRGLSQEDLANLLEISRQSVHKWEQGLSYPEIDKIKKLAQIFGVSIDALLNDEMDISAPVAQVSKVPAYRNVFVSKNTLKATHSDYDHCVTDKSKKKFRSTQNFFNERSAEFSKYIDAHGYDCVIFPQSELNCAFFVDEKQGICGFFYDGAEQFVLPIENIIDASITTEGISLGTTPRNYILSISYFTADGLTDIYNIKFNCSRSYFYFEGRKTDLTKTNILINALADETRKNLNEIRNKLIALKARGENIHSGVIQVKDIDTDELLKNSVEGTKKADEQRAQTEKIVKSKNTINTLITVGITLAVFTVGLIIVLVSA